jgi:hypothetical protein
MNIPEVANLEMVALSKDRIKVGCAEYGRDTAATWRGITSKARNGGAVFIHDERHYWITYPDCIRALRLMDACQEPKSPKFKVGDWVWVRGSRIGRIEALVGPDAAYRFLDPTGKEFVAYPDGVGAYGLEHWHPQVGDFVRCTNPSHPGPNPFRIAAVKGREEGNLLGFYWTKNEYNYPGCHTDSYRGCKPEWLVPAEEPKAETPPTPIGEDWKYIREEARHGGIHIWRAERLLLSLDERLTQLEKRDH